MNLGYLRNNQIIVKCRTQIILGVKRRTQSRNHDIFVESRKLEEPYYSRGSMKSTINPNNEHSRGSLNI